jgi:hypothetical protein
MGSIYRLAVSNPARSYSTDVPNRLDDVRANLRTAIRV